MQAGCSPRTKGEKGGKQKGLNQSWCDTLSVMTNLALYEFASALISWRRHISAAALCGVFLPIHVVCARLLRAELVAGEGDDLEGKTLLRQH